MDILTEGIQAILDKYGVETIKSNNAGKSIIQYTDGTIKVVDWQESEDLSELLCALQYDVVYEVDEDGCSAYVPKLMGCVACGDSKEEVEVLIRQSIIFHLEGMGIH